MLSPLLTAGGGRHNLDTASVLDNGARPLRTAQNLTVDRHRYPAGIYVETLQECLYRLWKKLFFVSVHVDHERLCAKPRAWFAASGASVTPWR